MLSVALSGLALICNFLRRHFCHLHAYLLACFYEKYLKFLTSHIYFHLDASELWKQYQSVSQEMMEQICDKKHIISFSKTTDDNLETISLCIKTYFVRLPSPLCDYVICERCLNCFVF